MSKIVINEGGAGAEQIVYKVLTDIVKEMGLEIYEELKRGYDLPVTVGNIKIGNNCMVDADLAAKSMKVE